MKSLSNADGAASTSKAHNEHVFEVRFAPHAGVLDHRGEWAEVLRERLSLPNWRIDVNRLDVHDETKELRCFVSVANAGFFVVATATREQFIDHANQFVRLRLSND